jgi:acyl carrier protein
VVLTLREVRTFLRQQLPEVLVPAALRVVQALPLTAQGKVERAALATVPVQERAEERMGEKQAPCTPLEEVLAGIWGQVLGLAEIGRDEDFFELGGHSLLAVRVIARIREVFQVDLPLLVIFGMPSIAELAAVIAQSQETAPLAGERIQALPRGNADIDQLLRELEQLPDAFVEQLLASEMQRGEQDDA